MLGLADLVIDICDIHHKFHVIAQIVTHDTAQNIGGDIIPGVSEMPCIINSRAAAIPCHTLPSRIQGHKFRLALAQGIVEPEISSFGHVRHGSAGGIALRGESAQLTEDADEARGTSEDPTHQGRKSTEDIDWP